MAFSKRLIQPEVLDHADPDEAKENLADLVRINSYFGGHSVLRRMLQQVWKPNENCRVLDIGAASGDIGRLIQHTYPAVSVTSLDYNAVNLGEASPPKIVANAFHLPFGAEAFDYVLSSLFLHHFEDDDVVLLLSEFNRVARRGVLVCDLERNILPFLFLPATKPLFGWRRITLHDGPISVRASFRAAELRALGERAGLSNPQVRAYRPAFRLTMTAVKNNKSLDA